jgi:hypothetical protein
MLSFDHLIGAGSSVAGTGNHPLITRNAQWRIALGNEDVDARGFPLQPAQRSQFPRSQWLPGAYTALGAPHVQRHRPAADHRQFGGLHVASQVGHTWQKA